MRVGLKYSQPGEDDEKFDDGHMKRFSTCTTYIMRKRTQRIGIMSNTKLCFFRTRYALLGEVEFIYSWAVVIFDEDEDKAATESSKHDSV